VRSSPAGLVVAMADPSDRHSVDEIRYAVGGEVLPTIARVTDLCQAIAAMWPEVEAPSADRDTEPGIFDEGEPIDLVRRVEGKGRANPELDHAEPHDWSNAAGIADEPSSIVLQMSDLLEIESKVEPVATFRPGVTGPTLESAPSVDATPPAASVALEPAPIASEPPAPKTAPEPAANGSEPAPSKRASDRASAEASEDAVEAPLLLTRTKTHRPRADDLRAKGPLDRRDGWAAGRSNPLGGAQLGDPGDRWSALGLPSEGDRPETRAVEAVSEERVKPETPLPPPKLSLRARKLIRASPRKPSRAEFGGLLVTIRQSHDRDEIVEVACEAFARFGRAVVFLALARGILKGRHAIGVGLTRDAIRNLWIPATSPSTFKAALDAKEPWRGPHGPTAADQVFRAAIGSRGRELALWPIVVAGKAVALVAVDDPADPEFAQELFDSIAASLGDAFQRIILTEKKS
jgi:hypothetical protein